MLTVQQSHKERNRPRQVSNPRPWIGSLALYRLEYSGVGWVYMKNDLLYYFFMHQECQVFKLLFL